MSLWRLPLVEKTVASLVALAVGMAGALGMYPEGPQAVQCPTAPVQLVAHSYQLRDCCGHSQTVTRLEAPSPGDKAFKACCCADKKKAQTAQAVATKKPILMATWGDAQSIAAEPLGGWHVFLRHGPACSTGTSPPETPPPPFV